MIKILTALQLFVSPAYAVQEEPWLTPVTGTDIIAESPQKGQEGQVTTIWGNGSQGQGKLTMDHPRKLQVDSKGNIYFIDGSQFTAKLRKVTKEGNKTIMDLVNNKTIRRQGFFAPTGLAIIEDKMYISDIYTVYCIENNHLRKLDAQIPAYLKRKGYDNIYRMRTYDDKLYIMAVTKSAEFGLFSYDLTSKSIEEVLPKKWYPSPYNFYVAEEGVQIACETGYIMYEQFFPRETRYKLDDSNSQMHIVDTWMNEEGDTYYATYEDQAYSRIYKGIKGTKGHYDYNPDIVIAGDVRGYSDGFGEEVQMDKPMDFVWDGTGYVFADYQNHAIRKLWTEDGPGNQ